MSFIDKIKDLVNVPDDDYDEEEIVKPAKKERSFRPTPAPERERKASADYSKFSQSYGEPARAPKAEEKNDRQNKVVNIHTTTQVQVVLAHPETFDGVTKIADHLNNKRTVVLNLEATQRDVARRIVDFLYGAAYANGGEIRRVAASTFIIIPHNVNIVGDLIDELENNGVFFNE